MENRSGRGVGPRLEGLRRTARFFLAACCFGLVLFEQPAAQADPPDIGLALDPAPGEVTGEFRAGSHVKVFLPNLPYLAISHAINASLVRPANNEQGWQYDLAISHHNIGDMVWEFELRQDVHFHDGSPFNADSVLLNMDYFKKQPFTFTKLSKIDRLARRVNTGTGD